jgi:hypothetical protein
MKRSCGIINLSAARAMPGGAAFGLKIAECA